MPTPDQSPLNDDKRLTTTDIDFTGERVIPGKVDIDLFNEHFVRYEYAREFCSGKCVLDTGCGTGYGTAHLGKAAKSVVGVDYQLSALLYAREHFAPSNVSYLVADCHHLPFSANHFDVVISFELIEHLADAKRYLREIGRVLRPDGAFIVSTPNRPIYHERREGAGNPFHVQEWDLEEFVALLKTSFPLVEVRGETHVSAVGILGSTAANSVPASVPQGRNLAKCDYFVCVCSRTSQHAGELLFVPGSANLLRERERHIHALTKEVQDRDAQLARLGPEFEQKAAWADKLNHDLAKTRSDYARLSAENSRLSRQVQEYATLLSKATRWKRLLAAGLLAPADLLSGVAVLTTDLLGKTLRLAARRSAPVAPVSDFKRCSVVIVTWEGKDLLSESLPPLVRAIHAHGTDHEIIVVDNGSTDGTEEYVRTHFPEIRVVRSERNLFFGGGNNLGVKEAHSDIIVLLNNDMIVHDNFLAPLLEPFRAPDIFAVASQVFLADPQKRREETGKTRAAFNGHELEWRHDTILPTDEAREYVPVFWGHGGAVAIDRKKFLWLGGFDNLYDPFYVEDADISYSAWKVGWRCLLAVKSKVIHKHRSSTSRFGPQFISQIVHRNQCLFLWKQFTDLDKLCAHFLHAPRGRMRRAGVPGIGVRVETKAFLGALKRLPKVLRQRLRLARWVARGDQDVFDITTNPAGEAIQASYIDFAKGPYTEHLGSGWYDLEGSEGKRYRWMGSRASVYLRTPPRGKTELVITGWAPSPPKQRPITLTVICSGQQRDFLLPEGPFQHRWELTNLPVDVPLELQLSVDQTVRSDRDARTLGLITENMGFVPEIQLSASSQSIRQSVSLSNVSHVATRVPGQKRILMLCAYLPCLGTHGGGNMMFNLIRTLSQRHRITVLSFYERDSELEHVRNLSQYCENLEVIYRGQNFETHNVFGVKPPEIIHEFYHRPMERLVRHYVATYDFDVIQCEYLQMAHFARIQPSLPAVLTNHEVLSFSYQNRFQKLPWSKRGKLKALVAWMRMLNYEERLLRRFAAVVVLTQPEAMFLSRYAPQTAVHCHPMGVDCDYFGSTGEPLQPGSVLFVGNFRHSPNVSGALWLLERIWPRVRQRCPQAELKIVGSKPTPAMQGWHGRNGVTITGWVKDVRPYLSQAAIVVAPLFEGVGMRTKVLEAWAMGKAVVGTELALEGLASVSGELCFIADEEAEFAARTCDLLEDQDLARSIGTRAHQRAKTELSWESFAQLYDHIYQMLLNEKAEEHPLTPSPASLRTVSSVHKFQA